tara:strand:- start:15006 stop:18209 length:3204 start_codon:yes stop_codon:yes gene_type:complete
MFLDSIRDVLLLGQVQIEVVREKMWYEQWYGIVLILFLIFAVPIGLGRGIASMVRMREYSWKIALIIFSALTASIVLMSREPNLGIDLGGGTILEYEVDQQKKDEVVGAGGGQGLMAKMVDSIRQRLDPAGVRQVSIRESGPERIEIKIPRVSQAEVELLKRKLVTAGNLEFRILADQEMDAALVRRAEGDMGANVRVIKDEDQPARKSEPMHDQVVAIARNSTGEIVTMGGVERARWVTVDPEKAAAVRSDPDLITRLGPDEKQIEQLIILGRELAEWMEVGMQESTVAGKPPTPRIMVDPFTVQRPRGDGGVDVLVKIDDQNVTGGYLSGANPGVSDGRVAVNFNFNVAGAKKFGQLTGANVRPSGRKRRLGIVLDDELLSAPSLNSVIRDSGQITGDFTQDDVDWLVGVLNAGSLPAALNKIPISEQRVEPTLGLATIESGKRAIGISLIAIALFMPLYYRFSGLVACFALILNLVLVLGVMLAIGATFTLPGLAGLVLTVGMAVDANVLIFERIREELLGGAALRMAIRNGFSRATRTIVDANLTTLITAFVLYVIGKDQLRGFAVTLILGIGMSMFTAIFCSRVIFDIAEKRRWISKLGMLRLLGKTSIDFIGKRHIAAVCSVGLIGLGLYGVFLRGPNLFDIDFRGGAKIEVVFAQPTSDGEVFETLSVHSEEQSLDNRLTDLKVVGVGENGFLIETTQADRSLVEDAIRTVFDGKLQTNTLTVEPQSVKPIPVAKAPVATETEATDSKKDIQDDKEKETTPPELEDPFAGGTEAKLVFAEPINQETLLDRFEGLVNDLQLGSPRISVSHPEVFGESSRRVAEWELKTTLNPDATEKLLTTFAARLKETPVFRSSTNVGGQVAGDTQNQAFVALFASLVFIIGYIWVRFQRVTFGLAAVVALVHDVLVTLGVIALSQFAASIPAIAGPLQLEAFKISLPILAAFLTIIGYSLNDTIVVFDRIREVRGKSPYLSAEMINKSINQTLSRTLLTSLTTLIVVVILYFLGGPGIHGFAFALVIGVIAGTYSSVFIASPVLLWMSGSQHANPARGAENSSRAVATG